ncbi:MAG: Uma2 family endonuclease [Hyphomicrobiaceae bacterium]|nr:MAG: Uma2 family endonuclease [Hyphomicrobiaceae bacterium]
MNIQNRPLARRERESPRLRLWTAQELERMLEAGILTEDDGIELIAGEVVAMAAKGARHEILRNELVLYWADTRPNTIKFAEEPPLRLSDHNEPEPDIILFPAPLRVTEVRGDSVLLVVEIADSSLSYDLGIKAPLYASFGVREYWVIDARSLDATVHRAPGPSGYTDIRKLKPDDVLTPLAGDALAVRLADLGLQPVGQDAG